MTEKWEIRIETFPHKKQSEFYLLYLYCNGRLQANLNSECKNLKNARQAAHRFVERIKNAEIMIKED